MSSEHRTSRLDAWPRFGTMTPNGTSYQLPPDRGTRTDGDHKGLYDVPTTHVCGTIATVYLHTPGPRPYRKNPSLVTTFLLGSSFEGTACRLIVCWSNSQHPIATPSGLMRGLAILFCVKSDSPCSRLLIRTYNCGGKLPNWIQVRQKYPQ